MNPFSLYLRHLRQRYDVSQGELARRMGYEQGYISGLENGKKGPPNEEFNQKFIAALSLNTEEQEVLRQVVEESQRVYTVPRDAPIEVFRLVHKLWNEMERLHPAQVRMMRETLSLQEKLQAPGHLDFSWDPEYSRKEESKM